MTFITMTAPTSGFLALLTEEEHEKLHAHGEFRPFKHRQVLTRQGEAQDTLMQILSGRLQVTCRSSAAAVKLAEIEAGQCLGEMSILDPQAASATVQALEAGELFAIDREGFDRFVDAHPRVGNRLLCHLGAQVPRRLRGLDKQMLLNSENRFGFDNDF